LGSDQEIVSIKTQYDQLSLASQPEHVLPTAFGEEGILLFKYLDSNMFAVTTANASDPTLITVTLVNGVTGSIIHQHSIDNVSISGKHSFATLFTENYFAASYQRFNSETGL
jgi:hypothetical protein